SALRGLDLDVEDGELASIIGPSGAGKSTLINILSGMDTPTGGLVLIKGVQIDRLAEKQRRDFRYNNIGLVNQFTSRNLFNNLTVRENLIMPMKMSFMPREVQKKEANELLDLFNLKHVKHNKATKISGGESMRLSVAIALARKPHFVLADEPTGQLDSKNTFEIIDTLKSVNKELGTTILIVTHDVRYRGVFNKSFLIRDGRLVGVGQDMKRQQLDFLKDASVLNRVYIDPSNSMRIPDRIKSSVALRDAAELDVHPSKKLALMWNPDLVSKEDVIEILKQPPDQWAETKDEITFEDVEYLFDRQFKPNPDAKTLIKVKNVEKGYKILGQINPVIKGIDLEINEGDLVFISGPSGVGKTTLLNLIAGLIKPDKGSIGIGKQTISKMDDTQVSDFRLANIAYITQYHSLFEPIQLEDNLHVPYLFLGKPFDQEYATHITQQCHIDHKLLSYPDELSAGEKQRATLSLALTRKTPILLADEPTANMDSDLARSVMDTLMDVIETNKSTFIMCSHDLSLLRPGFRHIKISDGIIVDDARITKRSLKKILKEYLQIEDEKNG
ncbi:MAG: ATP-binding cassette domain-containing protein, partial [Candidatus Heimdallarchaeota archaeon]|nr:ATP-binding cassette domain-containing protein [Candidatus Heimdallarchaeota archaeon]